MPEAEARGAVPFQSNRLEAENWKKTRDFVRDGK
jgi:hypothetical protein